MTKFEIYSLILCLIVLVILVSVFSYMLTIMIKQSLKQIKAGLEDEEIISKFNSDTSKKHSKLSKTFNAILTVLLCAFFGVIFVSSLYINCTQNTFFDNFPTYRVVLTSSMESKNENNTYLLENNLDNQISAFDLIATYKIPNEEDLKLYDIVVYEVDGILVVHRIVGIEEPNKYHPNERHFLLQGDAVGSPDRFPVLYSQMKGIYKNEKIPFVGSFVLFLQSPAGWLCMLLIFASFIATPILEKKLLDAQKARFLLLSQAQEVATTNEPSDSEHTVSQENVDSSEQAPSSKFGSFSPTKTFDEKLAIVNEQMQNRYYKVVNTLMRIEGVKVVAGKTQLSYKRKNICIARLFFRGKTLNVCLGLNAKEYENSKYVFTDLSENAKHKNYPMRIKLSSERQTRWACELIEELAKKNGLVLSTEPLIALPIEPIIAPYEQISPFAHLNGAKNKKSFFERLSELPIAKERFDAINSFLCSTNLVRVITGKHNLTYKIKNSPIAKLTIKGKTLNAYLGLNPKDFEKTKYIFVDVSHIKKYSNYPMRIKVSSTRQVRWLKELLQKIIQK